MSYKNVVAILLLSFFFSCEQNDNKKEKLVIVLKSDYQNYENTQKKIDSEFKKTEEELLKLRDTVKTKLGFFSSQYIEFDEDLKKYLNLLEEGVEKHKDVLYDHSVLEDNVLNESLNYKDAVEKKELIGKMLEQAEKEFERRLLSRDTLISKANTLMGNVKEK